MIHELLGYDLETTSKEAKSARVVQAAALLRKQDGEFQTIMNQLCNPGTDISDGAAEVHGITSEMVKDAEPDYLALTRLYGYILQAKDRIIIVGHNIVTYDLPILFRISGSGKIPVLWIDTFVAATRVFPNADSHKLSDLVSWLDLGSTDKAHDAEADIGMVFMLVDYIFNGLRGSDINKANWTYADFAHWCMQPRVLKRAHFGKHRGKLWGMPQKGEGTKKYVPRGYVHYICDKWEDPSPDMIETVWVKYKYRFKKLARRNA